jgi:shikimate kinase
MSGPGEGHELLALVGMPGSGKSTIGRQLARRIGWDFRDSDGVIETRIDGSIRSFFEREGEDRFREIESAVIGELSGLDRTVLATGGGAVLRVDNRRVLRERCHVVYLRCSPDELYRRLRTDTQRPLLQVGDPRSRLRELFTQRDPLYRETAHLIVDSGRATVPTQVNTLLMQLELAGIVMRRPDAAHTDEARNERR